MKPPSLSPLKRILIFAGLSIQIVAAAPEALIQLSGKEFGHNKNIIASSSRKISPSTVYNYKLSGKIRGTGALSAVLPKAISLDDFLDRIVNDGSSYLSGDIPNPSGELPLNLVRKSFSWQKNVPQVGKVSIQFRTNVAINSQGKVKLAITGVKVTTPQGPLEGTLKLSNARLLVTVAPRIAWKVPGISVKESTDSVKIRISRYDGKRTLVRVKYQTIDGTAKAGVDYQPAEGEIVFGPLETQKSFPLHLIDNSTKDGTRNFTIKLFDNSSNSIIGRDTLKVRIRDNE